MGRIFMISDTHFGDDGSIVKYEGRPFRNGDEMRETLIAKWNQTVEQEDTVYHLGDFASGLKQEEIVPIVQRLQGRKILIMGNHDRDYTVREWFSMGFDEVYPLPVIFREYYMLSHEPLYVNEASPYANIFGHVHNNPAYRDCSSRSFCACVERTGYRPVNFEVIRESIFAEDRKRREEKRSTNSEENRDCT